MPDPAPKPAPVPAALDKLLEKYPPDIQARFRALITKLHLENPHDPIFELMLVLGLWGTYYRETSGQIVTAGEQMEKKHAEALRLFDERVMALQSFSQVIRQGLERLEHVERTIVNEFPAGKVAELVVGKVNATLNTFPLDDLKKTVTDAHSSMTHAEKRVDSVSDTLGTAATRIEEAAARINAVKLPRLSVGWALFWMAVGAAIAVGVVLLFLSWAVPDARKVAGWVERRETGTVLIIPKNAFDDARTDGNENVVVPITKKAP